MPTTIAIIQTSPRIGHVGENLSNAVADIRAAAERGAKMIVLPELFNTGYFCHTSHVDTEYFRLAESIDGPTIGALRATAAATHSYICAGFFEKSRNRRYFNSACLIGDDGEIIGVYRKTHIPWSHTGWEKFYMRPGNDIPVFQTPLGRIGIMICYDRDFPEVARILAVKGADYILMPNGSSRSILPLYRKIVSVRAYENQVFIAAACLTGELDTEHGPLGGHSLLADPSGSIVAELDDEPGTLVTSVDPDELDEARMARFSWRDTRPDLYAAAYRHPEHGTPSAASHES